MVLTGSPRLGAHAASRTQSVCPCSAASWTQPPSPPRHTLAVLSQPAVTSRLTGAGGGCEETRLPGGSAGAQDTAVQPRVCALGICAVREAMGGGEVMRVETPAALVR
jgi:hypothetical protein